jgi:hypothetical protein
LPWPWMPQLSQSFSSFCQHPLSGHTPMPCHTSLGTPWISFIASERRLTHCLTSTVHLIKHQLMKMVHKGTERCPTEGCRVQHTAHPSSSNIHAASHLGELSTPPHGCQPLKGELQNTQWRTKSIPPMSSILKTPNGVLA